ncbi:hypothetical protein K7X08_025045 [Anisodus acutangulus]|uniref:Membrane-associated kinase regulator 5 n=1 Tax=Anisodus acutangulus TaxID=402998 RepID=A0A9Q1MB23_9SOLA|nr:hypothetical protein K7X08_025045 [Anisodus acutangulus]
MEAFNLLKFWRTNAVRDINSDIDSVKKFVHVVDYVSNPAAESTDEEIDNDEDSFFDLVLTGHNGHPKENNISKLNSPESPKDVFLKPIDANSKPHSPNSVLKSAPKFRVCFLGFRKSKPEKMCIDDSFKANPKIHDDHKLISPKAESKYLKLMKPLYSRASRRYTDKIEVSKKVSRVNQLFSPSRNSSEEKQGNRVAVLQAVRKRLGKSRSTASTSPMYRRDDSLLEKNDGIQGAILHCKRSYSSARKDSSVLLSRNANEDMPRASCEEQSRWSI